MENRRAIKVWLFLIALCMGLLVLGEHWGGRLGLFFGFLLAVALNGLIFIFGETRLFSLFQTRRLQGTDPWGLIEKVKELSKRVGIPTPNVQLMESETATAFSVGFASRRPTLCVSTGLLEKFNKEDLEAILAHQLCHIHRMDSFGFGVSSILATTLLGVAQFLDSLWPPNFFLEKHQRPFLVLFSPLGWLIIRLVVRRRTYAENDRLAAELIMNRERLGEVLWRLEGLAQARPLDVPPCTSHLFIVNPEGFRQKNFFLRSHPPLEERLRQLTGAPHV